MDDLVEEKKDHTLTEKEYYKEKIIDKIRKIDNLWVLSQIIRFVENITKGGVSRIKGGGLFAPF